jgi:hypothetical protein
MIRSFTRRLSELLLLVVVSSVCAFAQNARLTGVVNDGDGFPLANAKVQIVHAGDNVTQTVTTNDSGVYAVLHLAAGDYQVTVLADGFQPSAVQTVHLAADGSAELTVQLKVAETKQEITVTADNGGAVTLDTSALAGVVTEKEVTDLQLNGRNFSQLAAITPGVSNQSGQDEAKVGAAGSAKFTVNGGRVEYNVWEIDGSDVLNTSINASRGQGLPLEVYPSVDAIQEIQVLTSNYGAEYGKSASGTVLVTTKSGGADFHGNGYAFLRNEVFNARNYFDQPGRTPLYRRQDYGGTIGGPFYIPHVYNTGKDKTFFFFSEELRLEKTPVDYNQAVPTTAERGGDFSDVCGTPLVNGVPMGGASVQVAGHPDCPITIPSSNSSTGTPQSYERVNVGYIPQAILNTGVIPLPNSQFGCNSNNPTAFPHCYDAAVSPATYYREELFRIDQHLTTNQSLAFRYIHDSWNTTTLTPQYGVVQNSFPSVENKFYGPGLDMTLSLTSILPHNTLNRLTFAFSVQHLSLTTVDGPGVTTLGRPAVLDNDAPSVTGGAAIAGSPNCSLVTGPQPTPPGQGTAQQLTQCPLGNIFDNGFGGKLPGLVFQGNNQAYGGHGFNVDTGYAPWNQSNPNYVLRDDVNRVIGKHSLAAGFELTLAQQNEQSAVSGANSGDLQGLLTFSNQQSRYTTGNAFADFLASPGLYPLFNDGTGFQPLASNYTQTAIKSYTQDSGIRRYYNRYKAAEFYLQDDWKISGRLTVNLGFRASLFGAWYNPNNTAYNFEPQAYSKSLGGSIYVDPNYGELVRTTGTGASGVGTLPTVPLNLGNLDPTITNGLVQCGVNGVPQSCQANHLFNPGPRVGFAWDPSGTGRTSIRGGYGLFWEHGIGNEANTGSLIGSAPLILSETQSNPKGPNQNGASDLGAYNAIGQVPGVTGQQRNTFPLNVTAIPTVQHYAYTQQWSLSVQRELVKDLVGQMAYVGTKGTHLAAIRDLNQLPALASSANPFLPGQPLTSGICANGANQGVFPTGGTYNGSGTAQSPGIAGNQPGFINAFIACTGSPGFTAAGLGVSADAVRPYNGFSNVISVENIANSEYNALQATLRRTKRNLTLGVSYTFSHNLDDATDRSSNNFADSLNIRSNHSSSDFDQRQLFNFSYIYQLPLLRLLSAFTNFIPQDSGAVPTASTRLPDVAGPPPDSHLLKTLLDNWELSGITVYQSGTPFSVINAGGQGVGTATSDTYGGVATADNAGVGDGLGIGSYADINPNTHGTRPVVPSSGTTIGPLLGNPNTFVAPRGLTFGNSGRNYLNNPGRTNFNVALLKTFKVFGDRDLQFRTEAFNVFNHTQFRIYDPSHPGNTGNNVISCYGDIASQYSAAAQEPGIVNCLAGNSFLHPVDAHDPRILQFGLKLAF